MKKSIVILSLLTSSLVFCQTDASIDPRLLVNKELGAKAQEYYESDPGQYQFLLFELENAFFIRDYASLSDAQKSQLISIDGIVSVTGEKFDPQVLNDLSTFNFHQYNFLRSETQTIGYDLGNGKVLGFYSLEKLRVMYSQ